MKRIIIAGCSLFFITATALTACKPDPSLGPDHSGDIGFEVPKGWPAPVYNFQGNTLTKEGFELGKKIFFDQRLSRDNSTACGSCHQPFAAFAHLDHDLSHGINNQLGNRNSPPIFNMNWHTSFFWDGGVNHLEVQPIGPIQNPVEMGEQLEHVVAKLAADAEYKTMFKAAFGDETINSQRMLKALAQFMGSMVSSNSKFDKYRRGEAGGAMNESELNGLAVYQDKCAGCHKEPLFSDFEFRNNGLEPNALNDSGRARITHLPGDMRKFKTPSLRNLKYTPPYMHDGRFTTLEQVLDHYASGVKQSPTLDPMLQNGIQLTTQQRTDLLAFLNTLNDEEFVKDKRFQELK
ncbi:cytochrome-c peroxidase [Polluticoccus soli]|uniref:cytochrome-c peroxidase n=1 Tax=Polluticoccus soli TaxID=3034150 RepID=UPI0023E1268C|nr:cytochrome c peroxidase [Flavipsychrobacter sp. JY13-12]